MLHTLMLLCALTYGLKAFLFNNVEFCSTGDVSVSTNRSAVIQTIPAYPDNYPKNLDCTWLITAEDGAYTILRIRFFVLATYADYLSIGYGHNVTDDNTVVIRLTGVVPPNSVILNATTAWMQLTTPYGLWWGFVIEVDVNASKGQ